MTDDGNVETRPPLWIENKSSALKSELAKLSEAEQLEVLFNSAAADCHYSRATAVRLTPQLLEELIERADDGEQRKPLCQCKIEWSDMKQHTLVRLTVFVLYLYMGQEGISVFVFPVPNIYSAIALLFP